MASQVTIVNNILRRLREDTVTNVNDTTYAQLIGQFVNDAKADCEDSHHWSVYVTEISTTILADGSTRTYDLTSTNDRSWLIRDHNFKQYPAAYDVTSNETGQLMDVPYKELLRVRALETDTSKTVTIPRSFSVTADSDGRGWTIETVWPVTSTESARSWNTYWYIPQADLALDGTDDDTEIKIPARPIELQAYYYALNERGEEMGQAGGIAFERARDSLGAAIEVDRQVQIIELGGDFRNDEYL